MANSFLRRVRIHGGEFGASARAMHRNAELGKAPNSTIERKQMSTTIKRVALVAVAALGFGVLSTVPSSAVINNDSLTLSSATAAQTTAETYTATSAVATLSFLPSATSDSISVTAALVSGPAGTTALPYLRLVETASATIDGANKDKGYSVAPNTATIVKAGAATTTTTAKYAVFLAKGDTTTAPTTVGTYVVKLTPAAQGNGALLGSTAQTLTITVTAAATLDTVASIALSSSIISSGDTNSAVVDDTVLGSKDIQTAPSAIISVTQKNAAGGNAAESMTVTIAGPGTIVSGPMGGATSGLTKSGARALTVKNGDVIAVFSDGTSGVATITIATSAGTLATEKVTFYDTKPASATATVKKAYILAGTAAVANVFAVVVKDSAGNAVQNAAVTAAPTDTATTVGGAATCTWDTTDLVYYCNVAGLSATKFGKVNYTIKATGVDTAKTVVSTTADVTFSAGVAAKFVVSGPATAEPGATITYTITMTDANGYPVADQKYGANTGGNNIFSATATKSTSTGFTTAPFAITDSWTSVSGVITSKGVLPVAGSGSATWTLVGDGTGTTDAIATALEATTVTVTTTVANPAIDAATDAANEATDAANAATDAANAAAEAADAATAAAQDAADAVAALSTQVNDLISALRKQITSLTSIVLKIQKKVKA